MSNKIKFTGIMLTPEEKNNLRIIADKLGISMSDFIRQSFLRKLNEEMIYFNIKQEVEATA